MVLAQAVTHPQRADTVLLRPGATLDKCSAPKLAELGVREIWIRHPGLEDLVRYADPVTLAVYRGVVDRVGQALDLAAKTDAASVEYHQYRDAVVGLLQRLTGNPSSALLVAELGACAGHAARHAGNTCFVSLLLGLRLDYYLIRERSRMNAYTAKDLSSLGLGAMFHDVGLSRLSGEQLAAWRAAGGETDAAWSRHSIIGYDMVKDHLDPAAAGVVLHHHQHFDGSGHPHRIDPNGASVPLRGSEIHVYARIVACAELYDRVRYGAFAPGDVEGAPIPAAKALAAMRRSPIRDWLDPVVLRTLHQVVPAFAPGTLVELSDGRRGAVAEWNPKAPCRPRILIVNEPIGRSRKAGTGVDLAVEHGLSIARVDGVDVSGDLFTMHELGEKALAA